MANILYVVVVPLILFPLTQAYPDALTCGVRNNRQGKDLRADCTCADDMVTHYFNVCPERREVSTGQVVGKYVEALLTCLECIES